MKVTYTPQNEQVSIHYWVERDLTVNDGMLGMLGYALGQKPLKARLRVGRTEYAVRKRLEANKALRGLDEATEGCNE